MTTTLPANPLRPGLEPTGPQYAPPPLPRLGVERVLGRVRKPGRYAGGEWNSVPKDWAIVALKWCFAYPDLYEIGMSNLGLRILYEVVNDRPDRLAERCFSPDVDLQAQLRSARLPLWSLETRRALRDFDVLGVSLGYELTYTNLLDMLDLSAVPLTTERRTEDDPLVIAGGSSVLNPEPIAEFLDAVVLGEGEDVVLEISDALERMGWHRRLRPDGEWRRGVARADALRALARIPGVYVPSLYRPHYNSDGTFDRLEPLDPEVPPQITGRIAADFETEVHGIRQLVPNIAIVFDRAQLEVMRGCTRGCRFCQAGMQLPAAARARPRRGRRGRPGDPARDRLRGDRPDQPVDRRLHVRERGRDRPPPPAPPGDGLASRARAWMPSPSSWSTPSSPAAAAAASRSRPRRAASGCATSSTRA